MRQFIYFSDVMLIFLLPQFPTFMERLPHKGVATGSDLQMSGSEVAPSGMTRLSEDRVERLELVESYIRQTIEIGSVRKPRDWISGQLSMRWGLLDNEVTRGQLTDLVWFTGNHRDAVLGMGGSRRHFFGTGLAPHDGHLESANLPALAFALSAGDPVLSWYTPTPETNEPNPRRLDDHWALDGVQNLFNSYEAPEQKVEFLARTLVTREDVTLATPLYVALPA